MEQNASFLSMFLVLALNDGAVFLWPLSFLVSLLPVGRCIFLLWLTLRHNLCLWSPTASDLGAGVGFSVVPVPGMEWAPCLSVRVECCPIALPVAAV